jgi:hypothetical protein
MINLFQVFMNCSESYILLKMHFSLSVITLSLNTWESEGYFTSSLTFNAFHISLEIDKLLHKLNLKVKIIIIIIITQWFMI